MNKSSEYISGKKFLISFVNNDKYILVTDKKGNEKIRLYNGTIDDYEKTGNKCVACETDILLRRGILFWSKPQHNKEICGIKIQNTKDWICYSCAVGGLRHRLAQIPKRPPDQWRGSYKLSDGGGGLRD